ncbi:hypothetical protein BCR43DRAFT_519136 [Syncephalastrum racemosum]|uniref:Uncharacterized protein n=1 Tax=Syncephalastrum racemosum TaxID=13706 RepID=A0A1X2GZ91_SYNRA|nr:hypothetical protein BCR43DRAFT_519136 [Syncephalastrum racemosum]
MNNNMNSDNQELSALMETQQWTDPFWTAWTQAALEAQETQPQALDVQAQAAPFGGQGAPIFGSQDMQQLQLQELDASLTEPQQELPDWAMLTLATGISFPTSSSTRTMNPLSLMSQAQDATTDNNTLFSPNELNDAMPHIPHTEENEQTLPTTTNQPQLLLTSAFTPEPETPPYSPVPMTPVSDLTSESDYEHDTSSDCTNSSDESIDDDIDISQESELDEPSVTHMFSNYIETLKKDFRVCSRTREKLLHNLVLWQQEQHEYELADQCYQRFAADRKRADERRREKAADICRLVDLLEERYNIADRFAKGRRNATLYLMLRRQIGDIDDRRKISRQLNTLRRLKEKKDKINMKRRIKKSSGRAFNRAEDM